MFKESISVEELVELPLKSFEGEINLIEDETAMHLALRYMRKYPILGFDTETKPAFHKGQFHKVALLQLATPKKVFIFRLHQLGLPKELCNLFSNPKLIKAGVAIRDDIKALQKLSPFKPSGFVELQNHAQEAGIQNISLKKLCAIVCGFRISKSQQLSNWESDVLSDQQIIYAATDAWVSLKIYNALVKNRE